MKISDSNNDFPVVDETLERKRRSNETKCSKSELATYFSYEINTAPYFFNEYPSDNYTFLDKKTPGLADYILTGRIAAVFGGQLGSLKINKNEIYTLNQFSMKNFYIAIYCDIIEPQYFGNKKCEIIKMIPVTDETSSSQALINYYDNPHYVPVRLNYINTIRIRLQDLHDNLIKFVSGTTFVVCKLHFKKR